VNLVDPDEDAGLDHVAQVAREGRPEATLSNSFGFGGHNAALLLRAIG
jgi:3-oxoacyl-[acyl-carrier-protein] synthase II